MENDIIPTINAEPKAMDRDSRLNAGNRPDEKEKDDSCVKLPEKDLVMKRPPAGQAPDPSQKQDDFVSSEVNHH